jgi:hypothetical protein
MMFVIYLLFFLFGIHCLKEKAFGTKIVGFILVIGVIGIFWQWLFGVSLASSIEFILHGFKTVFNTVKDNVQLVCN